MLPSKANRAQRVDRSQKHYRSNRGFYRHNGHTYYNGHRGYRHPRRGYRQYNGWWFPYGAFTFGPTYNYPSYPYYRSRGLSQAHYNWCYRKYRSYRAYDNTFQPYNGPRRACRSPYWP
ncbi:BA14K family protein [uncultured Roseibium sp.]|uniref:BA14K family protein n=1 Tax=uncultured Roseibium sp. TaxID=1936171 RepID=UPI0037483938